MKSTINEKGILLSNLANKYLAILKTGLIKNSELISMFSFLNGKATTEERQAISSFLWEHNDKDKSVLLSEEQNLKGITYLLNQYKTPTGKEKINSPFGYREINIIENFSHFELIGEYDSGNYNRNFYVPLYRVVSKDGNTFDYYFNGKINIIG